MEHRWRFTVLLVTLMYFGVSASEPLTESTSHNSSSVSTTKESDTTTYPVVQSQELTTAYSVSEPFNIAKQHSSTTVEVSITNKPPTSCHIRHDTTGKVNVVFLLDQSKSLGDDKFSDTVRPLVRKILEDYYTVRPTATRVAMVLFAGEGTVVMDYISTPGPSQPYQCEMFAENGTFNQLVIKGGEDTGENLIG